MKKFIVCFFALIFVFNLNVSAEYEADMYGNIVDESGIGEIENYIDDSTKKILNDNGIQPSDPDWSSNLSAKNIFEVITEFIKSGGKKPFVIALQTLGIIILCTLMRHFSVGGVSQKSVQYIGLVVFIGIMGIELYSIINASITLIKTLSAFMTAFVPVMAAILAASSRGITAAGTSGVMLLACSTLSNLAAFFLAPCMSGYLAISMCAGFADNKGLMKFSSAFKKTIMWTFSLAVSIFLGILSIKGGIDSIKDTLSLKTLRYVLGSTVPVAGTVLSESVNNLVYSLTLLKKSAGMYAIIAITLMVAPILIEILCFRLSIFLLSATAELFECDTFSKSIEIFDDMLSLLTGLLLLVFALFVISLGIVVSI